MSGLDTRSLWAVVEHLAMRLCLCNSTHMCTVYYIKSRMYVTIFIYIYRHMWLYVSIYIYIYVYIGYDMMRCDLCACDHWMSNLRNVNYYEPAGQRLLNLMLPSMHITCNHSWSHMSYGNLEYHCKFTKINDNMWIWRIVSWHNHHWEYHISEKSWHGDCIVNWTDCASSSYFEPCELLKCHRMYQNDQLMTMRT